MLLGKYQKIFKKLSSETNILNLIVLTGVSSSTQNTTAELVSSF